MSWIWDPEKNTVKGEWSQKVVKGPCLEQLTDAIAKLNSVGESRVLDVDHLVQKYHLCVLREAAESMIHVDAAVDSVSVGTPLGIPD
jgi:hypothetical protein